MIRNSLLIITALLVIVCTAKEHKEDDGDKRHKDKDKIPEDDKIHDHEDDDEMKHDKNKDHKEDESKKHDKDKDHDDDEEKKHDKNKDHKEDECKKHDKDHNEHDKDHGEHDEDHGDDEERPIRKWKHHFTSKYRRPLDLHIRVPFFTLFLKRDHNGPSKLGLQVFPDHHQHDHHHGSLVDIHHRWWKK